MDGVLTAFDTQYYQSIGSIVDQKGCHAYAVNEAARTLVLANKKKLFYYSWLAPGFAPIREFVLADVPKSLLCARTSVVVGYRKHYECVELTTGNSNRMLDVEREHKMVITEVRSACYLCLSIGRSLGTVG